MWALGLQEVMEGWFLGAHYPAGNVLDDAYQARSACPATTAAAAAHVRQRSAATN